MGHHPQSPFFQDGLSPWGPFLQGHRRLVECRSSEPCPCSPIGWHLPNDPITKDIYTHTHTQRRALIFLLLSYCPGLSSWPQSLLLKYDLALGPQYSHQVVPCQRPHPLLKRLLSVHQLHLDSPAPSCQPGPKLLMKALSCWPVPGDSHQDLTVTPAGHSPSLPSHSGCSIRHIGPAILPQMSSGPIPLLWDSQARLFAQLRVLEGQTFTSTEEAEGASAEGSCRQGHQLVTK